MLRFPFNQAPATEVPARRGAGRPAPKANTVITGCGREANDGLAGLPFPWGGYLVPVLSRVAPLSALGPSGATGRTKTKELPASGTLSLSNTVPFMCSASLREM